jgi:hypothetical protein
MSDEEEAQPTPRRNALTVRNRHVEVPRDAVQDLSERGEPSTDVTSPDQEGFFSAAAQVYLQADCDDARAMLSDGGKDIQIKICQQLAQAHDAAIKLLHRGMGEYNTVEAARLANVAARLMTVFQQGVLALRHIQAGGERITLQQVNVSGGNALVAANVSIGTRSPSTGREEKEK